MTLYHCSIESVLAYCITVWYTNCSSAGGRTLYPEINQVRGHQLWPDLEKDRLFQMYIAKNML